MRKIHLVLLISLIFLLPAISGGQNVQNTNNDTNGAANDNGALGLPGDNLNLYAVMQIFRDSETLEIFEKRLNDENADFNNLDLNGDGQIDYINVSYNINENLHTITLSVALNDTEYQDIAAIYVETDGNNPPRIDMVGNEAMYGKDYIVEPDYQDNGQAKQQ